MSNEILSDLLLEYDQKKRKAELDLEKRKQELYEKVPRLQEIEDSLNTFAITTTKNILNGNTTSFNELIVFFLHVLKFNFFFLGGGDFFSPLFSCVYSFGKYDFSALYIFGMVFNTFLICKIDKIII